MAVCACVIVAALVQSAGASHNFTEHVSTGPGGGNGAHDAFFRAVGTDGVRELFETQESLLAADTDAQFDLYERNSTTGALSLLSTGPAGGNGAFEATYRHNSADATRAFFDTREALTADDTDASIDLYERSAGTTTRVSQGAINGNGAFNATFKGASNTATRVFFVTQERLVAADTDFDQDVYERSAGTTTWISSGAINGNGSFPASFVDASADGTRVLFDTREQLVAADTDSFYDLYERSGGVTTLISTGPTAVNPADAFFAGASDDGTHVFWHTSERMVAGDTDSSIDVYERSGGTTTHTSTGGNGAFVAILRGVSADGTRAFFDTIEQLAATDTDVNVKDLYERFGGVTSHLSRGPTSGVGTYPASYRGQTPDGTRVYFESQEPLVATDTDSQTDVYERSGSTTTLISTGPDGGNGPLPAGFDFVSTTGTRVFFHTDESLVAADTDVFNDVYERSGGVTTIASGGLTGGNGNNFADFAGASADGSRVYLHTDEALTNSDADADCSPDPGVQGCQDVYAEKIAPSYARPGSGTPLRVPLVPAYAECTSPNTTHVAPKLGPGPGAEDPACSPPVLPATGQLTMGTAGAGSAFTKLRAIPGNPATAADEADIAVTANATDVRNRVGGTDYTGNVLLAARLRITDQASGSAQSTPATAQDVTGSLPMPCTATAGANGAICTVTSTMDTLVPGFAREGKLAIYSFLSVEVLDAGPDGNVNVAGCPPACGTADETVFLREGFVTP